MTPPKTAHRTDGKAAFDHIYDQPDPREYFRTLRPLRYQIPALAGPVFRRLLEAHPGDVLDVCCSYGINAALLRCELSLDELYERYGSDEVAGLSTDELAAADRDWYAARLRPHPRRVLGLDAARQAVAYAERVGLIGGSASQNLEDADPSPSFAAKLAPVGLVVVTGGIGYVTDRTFERLLGALPEATEPWVASFCLRTYSYTDIAGVLARRGLVTEQAEGTFRQRQFASNGERTAALSAVRARGLDPTDKEETGWYHCDLFVSRPAEEARAQPLADLLH